MKAERDDDLRLDRGHFSLAKLSGFDDTVAYWLSRSVDERLQGIERLRIAFYGESETRGRIQRVMEVVRLETI